MCVHMSPGTEGVVDAKLVPVLVGKLLNEEDEIKVQIVCTLYTKSCTCMWRPLGQHVQCSPLSSH